MPVPFDRPQAFELNTDHADRPGDRRYTCAGCAHLGAGPNFLNRYDRCPAQPACARSSSKLPTLSTNDGAVHGLFRISLGSLLPGFEVLGNDRKVARDGRLSNLRDHRVRDPAPRLLEVLVGVTGSVAVADERGRLTTATPAKNPRHRARAARPLSNGRSP